MIKVFEAFSGIGAQRKALENLGIDHEYATTDRAYSIENEDQRYVVIIPNSKRDYELTIVHKDENGKVRPLTLAIDIINRYPKLYSMTEDEIRQDAKWALSEELMVKVEQFVEDLA